MRHLLSNPVIKSLALAAMASFSLPFSLNAQIRYELVVPEVFGSQINRAGTRGNEINENGETLLNRVATFAVWKDGATTNVVNANTDYPASLSRIGAASINKFQQAVGTKTYIVRDDNGSRFDTFPFYWDPSNGLVDLDDIGARSPLGAGSTSLFDINEVGMAIGTSQNFAGEDIVGNSAFAWSFETGRIDIPALDTIETHSVTTPKAISESGNVVGTYRLFLDSAAHYTERAFLFEPNAGSVDLEDFDADFFQATHSTARDINRHEKMVGELDQGAYLYDLAKRAGHFIPAPSDSAGAIRAYALNDKDIVAGTAEMRDSDGHSGFSPILWSEDTGTIDLMPHLEQKLAGILPEGVDSLDCRITPKSINNRGQISASLETQASFSREVVLNPVLEFDWNSMTPTSENGVRGVLYRHDKAQLEGTIPASALGYDIGFECSSDMQNWSPIETENGAIRHLETDDSIELFLPFSDCVFVRPVLVTASN
ncbi:hypothetical protein VDG1235_636 [Verrucomicrobiia bacterium DG1235]|nr:hypothetical protein VDG1235_636 [Verrucomicrobiae bacterium DG1235]